MSNAAPPGWYADPSNPAHEHWWDGTAYTQSRPTAPAPVYSAPAAPAPAPAAAAYAGRVSPKSRTVASILGFFLGGLGVDRFYLGNIGMGVAKLLVGWLTLGIWPLIDWIIILAGGAHDGEGLPVTNWS
jgi:predicted lipid-binding transport protein (Tim44 family)